MADRFDVVVVGAGTAGLHAAGAAAAGGMAVLLLDENPEPGGQIHRAQKGKLHPEIAELMEQIERHGVKIRRSTTVFDASPGKLLCESPTGRMEIAYGKLVLATGSRELFLPFPGWTLPNVMGAGGLQALAKAGLDLKGKRVVVAGSGPLLLAVAKYVGAKAKVPLVAEQTSYENLAKFLFKWSGLLREGPQYASVLPRYRAGTWVQRANGKDQLESVQITNGATTKVIPCDYLAISYGLIPNLELPRLLGCKIRRGAVEVDETMRSSVANVYCVGELTGIAGRDSAMVQGLIAGMSMTGTIESPPFPDGSDINMDFLQRRREINIDFAKRLATAFEVREEVLDLAEEDTIVCRCEDVRMSSLTGQPSARDAKLQTRCGMGPCQGRICGPALNHLFGWTPDSTRPPVSPVHVGTLVEEE